MVSECWATAVNTQLTVQDQKPLPQKCVLKIMNKIEEYLWTSD